MSYWLDFLPGFVLQDSSGGTYSSEQLMFDAGVAGLSLGSRTRVTIDACDARSVLVGLLLCDRYRIDVGLSRNAGADMGSSGPPLELASGVFGWLDDDRASVGAGVRIASSGTTGRSKVAFYSLKNLTSAIRSAHSSVLGTNVHWLLTYEPASFAGIQVLLTAATIGARLSAPARNIQSLASSLLLGCTHVSGTPTFWRALLSALPRGQSPPLRVATLGGELCTQDLLDQIRIRFPTAAIRHIYASTEGGVGFTVADGRAGFPSTWLIDGVEGIRLRIVEGELHVSTDRGMLNLIGDDRSPFESGWLRTGDLAEVHGDRVLFQGRRDHIVNIGGVKILPENVELLLGGVDGVSDIVISAQPNPIVGYLLVARVCIQAGVERKALEGALRARADTVLPPVARPVRYHFVDSVASASGKKAGRYVE